MPKTNNTTQTYPFRHCLVFFNPQSTHADLALKRIDELKTALGPDCKVDIAELKAEPGKSLTGAIHKHLVTLSGKANLIAIAAGDGTTNRVIQTLLVADGLPKTARQTPILPLWGGNANDLAYMLNGGATRGKITEVVKHAAVVPIHPLECTTNSRGKKHIYIAACYASFGATAFAAQRLNAESHRKSRLARLPGGYMLQEIITVATAFLTAPSFAVKDADNVRVVYERTFANGSRMAKIKRLPIQLTDEMFMLNTLENKRLVSILPRLIEMTRKQMSDKFLRNYDSFRLEEESWAQFDGEPTLIPAHTNIQVQLSPRPFYALSLNFKQDKDS